MLLEKVAEKCRYIFVGTMLLGNDNIENGKMLYGDSMGRIGTKTNNVIQHPKALCYQGMSGIMENKLWKQIV